jgi:hypothetical protein
VSADRVVRELEGAVRDLDMADYLSKHCGTDPAAWRSSAVQSIQAALDILTSAKAGTPLSEAAPDLLAACRLHDTYMAARYSGPHSEALHAVAAENWRAIRAAIAKAESK